MISGFALSTTAFVFQAQGSCLPLGAQHCLSLCPVELGMWAALPHLWSRNAAAEARGGAASSPVLPRHTGCAAGSRGEDLLCTVCGFHRGTLRSWWEDVAPWVGCLGQSLSNFGPVAFFLPQGGD